MKKFATAVGTVALLVAAVFPAIAAGNSCTNGTTGPFSNNTCTITNSTKVTVNNVNDAQIVNLVRAVSSTGGNSASNNTLGGNITTGNASLNTTVSSVANVNTTNISIGWAGANNVGENNVTGPSSRNSAWINNGQDVDVWNSNTASVFNGVNTRADTGENSADNNTGPAIIRTGSSYLATTVGSHVNDNYQFISLGAGGSGNNTAGSSTTGPFSYNEAVVNNTADVNVNNVNDLQVVNLVRARSLTGDNSASNNTLGGAIATGNAAADVEVGTEGNINTTEIAAAFGGFNNVAGNAVTGPGPNSNNVAWINNERVVTVDNWNNKCMSHNRDRLWDRDFLRRLLQGGDFDTDAFGGSGDCVENLGVLNLVDSTSDAGGSAADNNTGGGSVVAGWASLFETVVSHLNDTVTLLTL